MRRTTRILSLCAVCLVATACISRPPPIDAHTAPVVVDEDGPLPEQQADKVVEELVEDAIDPQAFAELLNATGSLSASPLYVDNKVDLLIDGPATYSAMISEIEAARESIFLETFIFANDSVGQRFASLLRDKAEQGVDVRVLFDSLGSIASGEDFFDEMRASGVTVLKYNSLNPLDGGNPLALNNRDHRKLLVIDNQVAFTGGINLSNTYSSRPGQRDVDNPLREGWRDTHVAVYGPAVLGLLRSFERNWRELSGEAFVPVSPNEGEIEKRGSDRLFVMDAVGGDRIESQIHHAYLQAIRLAQRNIWITQAYFVPDRELIDGLRGAAKRGVDVRVVLPGLSDSNLVRNASRSFYGKLLKDGVRIFETRTVMLHAKTAVVDRIWSTVGSANLDPRSKLHNDETNVVVVGTNFAIQMERQFVKDENTAVEVTLEQWRRRGIKARMAEWFSRRLAYWL